jgi:ABC-type oligopeptide transport system substrate-binding subunit/class 3 adenylate cyclase
MGDKGMREERKVVTALFADLVGSTALGERLDPEEVKLIVGEAVSRIVGVVERFGGTVKDLAGDGVLALFGAPTAHEDDPERALRAGLDIVEELRAYGHEVAAAWGIDGFSVRVGVNTGPAVLGPLGAGARVEYAAFGDTVNTAARLQASAEPGAVLAGGSTRRTTEDLFEWTAPRSLELKGKGAPVSASGVVAVRPSTGRGRAVRELRARFVGRERELATAVELLEGVLAGSGGILFVTGEAGIGKSRLLDELRERFEAASAPRGTPLWLEGRCVSYGDTFPYWPFRELLREWLGVGVDEPELKVRVALRRGVERLFGVRTLEIYPYLGAMLGLSLEPDATARLSELSPEALQYRTFEVVEHLLERLADDGPVVVAVEDLHWADPTSIQLMERLLPVTELAAVLVTVTQRTERDHSSWAVKETASRQLPHRTREIALEALSGHADRELLHTLVAEDTLPQDLERRVLADAEGNPFFLEELVRSLIDHGALLREGGRWSFDHDVDVQVPETVEKVVLARIDRLPHAPRAVLTAASVLGRRFGLALLEEVTGGDGSVRESVSELQRLDLVREARRWPEPEYRFKHALIQEAAYRTILTPQRTALHRKAAEWLERRYDDNLEEVLGLLAHHWSSAADEDKAVAYLARAGDKARQEYALDEAIAHYRELLPLLERRGARQEMALVLFKLALALHTSLRFAEANEAYQRAFELWSRPASFPGPVTATLRMTSSFLPGDPDPKSAIAWPDIQLCMQLFDRLVEAWPERTLVPSLAERWEIAEDGLRYVFHLREGLRWSDGVPLTAQDVEFGIKRVLDPERPGSSVAIYFVLENGQDFALGRNRDSDRIGVRAVDDRTVEFRLAAPAPYFMSVMNRPDGGPQPRHSIDEHGERWTEPDLQVVSGPFRQAQRTPFAVALAREPGYAGIRPGNVERVEIVRSPVIDALGPYAREELDVINVRYTPRSADLMPQSPEESVAGGAGWTYYITFDHSHPIGANRYLRLALAHAIDRKALREQLPSNLIVATGGLVPPSLQGHTPDIAPSFDPDRAAELLRQSGFEGRLEVMDVEDRAVIVEAVVPMWRRVLGLDVELKVLSLAEAIALARKWDAAPLVVSGWLPGYPDPEYFLRLLLHSESKTNEGGFASAEFDDLIERARQERDGRARLELFHQADRMAVTDQAAIIPLAYGKSMAFVKPWVQGWWEFGKSSASFADLVVDPSSPRA